jgi:hypothetical protein
MASELSGKSTEHHHAIMISLCPGFVPFVAVTAVDEDNAR